MSIHSINTFAQTVFLKIPLKTVQSISWIALSILTLPSSVIGGTHSYFFARKAVEVWTESKTEATIKASKANPNTNLSTNSILGQWVKDAPREENRVAAQERIQKFFSEQENDSLALNKLTLTSLPNIFNDSCFSRLKSLDLGYNQLRTLPESFGNLQMLTKLDLGYNQLRTLPESFSNLQMLTKLDLGYNQLRTLPESFDNLQALTTLELSGNRLEAQSESFGNLQTLIRLELGGNQLTFLPESFGNLQMLTKLDLGGNQLQTLPESFGNLQTLIMLELDYNQLTILPESFGNLQALTTLELDRNQLTTLSESLGNLQTLSRLELGHNQLTTLPESFGKLQALTTLCLGYNQLEALSESFGNLQTLTELDLGYNQLTTLPESFDNLQALTTLELSGNRIEALPESFGNLQALSTLELDYNQLTTLPESFGNLQALTWLHLNGNSTLRGIPVEMLRLSSNCEIGLTECGLSMDILERLRELMRGSDYTGPRISYSIADIRLEIEEKSIQESLNSLYAIIGKMPREFAELEKTAELRSWLNRLSDTADYKIGGELKKAFAKKIIEYLSQANENIDFRSIFNEIITDASATCGDRVALSVLHLSVAYQLATIDLKDMKKLADFLIKGPWTIEMLENIAREKIPTLPFFDEIEVYLGYPIKLKQELQIPIDVQGMLFFRDSALKPEDLEEAKNFVLIKQNNQEARLEFLINSDKWKDALFVNYPQEYRAILDKRTKAAKQGDVDYSILAEEYKKDLIKLTKKALEPTTFSEQRSIS